MKYKLIVEKGKYSLILRGVHMEEYAVVYGLNKELGEWAHTCDYWSFDKYSSCTKEEALYYALDCFLMMTKEKFINRCRLEELATLFKDGLIEADEGLAHEYFDEVCYMNDEEKEFFGIETETEQ